MESRGRNDWLASQSLERSLDIISAINRLSIHSKLRLAGIPDDATSEETEEARNSLKEFVGTLNDLIDRAKNSQDRITFGVDPRLGSLARRFLPDPQETADPVVSRFDELRELRVLLDQGDSVNHELLIRELGHLRAILEQHSQADAAIIFNEA